MTDYECRKIAKMQAEYLALALKEDNELLDLMFPPKCMNIEEASAFLSIPVGTLYKKMNEIPHEKCGKRIIFTDRGLMRWLKRKTGRETKEVHIDLQLKKVM